MLRTLFDLSLTIEKEVGFYLPEPTGVDIGIQAVDTWKTNRLVLRSSLDTLCSATYFKVTNRLFSGHVL